MENSARTILITGANGFVGSRLCHRFADHGYRVIAGVRPSAKLELLEGTEVEYRHGDVTQPESLVEMVKGVDYIIHNAGLVKAKGPDHFFRVNVKGTQNLCEAVLEQNPEIKKLIYISSLAAAGPSLDGRPVKESDQPHPVSFYGKSKLGGEQVAHSFADRLNILSIRPPGVYGPGDTEIFSLFQTTHYHLRPVIGNQKRLLQLVHVDDLVRGIQLALEAETESGESFFIGENRAYRMSELARLLHQAIGRWAIPVIIPSPIFRLIAMISEAIFNILDATPMLTPDKAEELLCAWAMDGSKAKTKLGFESQIDLASGLKSTYQWYLKHGWLK